MGFISDWSASFKIYRAKFNGSWPAKLTAFWLLLVVGSSALNWQAFCGLGPNEWGDFLAGTMSPIAFMWLVFGYLQQGRELKQNTEALQLQYKALVLQHKELAEQVKATLKVAEHSEQQAVASTAIVELNLAERKDKENEAIEAIQPKFTFTTSEFSNETKLAYAIVNHGSEAREVLVTAENFENIEADIPTRFSSKRQGTVFFYPLRPESSVDCFRVFVFYTDVHGNKNRQQFSIRSGVSYYEGREGLGSSLPQ